MRSLVETILNGDKNAFSQIVSKFNKQFMKIAFQYSHDWDCAADITQDTFVKSFKKLDSFDITKPFNSWIYRIHINNCKNFSRKEKFKRIFFLDYRSAETDSIPQDVQPIMSCIKNLSTNQQTAFILMELEEKSSKEAGEIMGCAAETTRVHLNRAKTNLKKQLTKMGYSENEI